MVRQYDVHECFDGECIGMRVPPSMPQCMYVAVPTLVAKQSKRQVDTRISQRFSDYLMGGNVEVCARIRFGRQRTLQSNRAE